MKLKVLKPIKLGGPNGLKTHQPGELVDVFNNSQVYVEMGFVIPVDDGARPAPTTPVAQKAPPAPKPPVVEDAAPVETKSDDTVYFTREDLESLYKRDLKELARKFDIDDSQTKAELIDAIEAAQK